MADGERPDDDAFCVGLSAISAALAVTPRFMRPRMSSFPLPISLSAPTLDDPTDPADWLAIACARAPVPHAVPDGAYASPELAEGDAIHATVA